MKNFDIFCSGIAVGALIGIIVGLLISYCIPENSHVDNINKKQFIEALDFVSTMACIDGVSQTIQHIVDNTADLPQCKKISYRWTEAYK